LIRSVEVLALLVAFCAGSTRLLSDQARVSDGPRREGWAAVPAGEALVL